MPRIELQNVSQLAREVSRLASPRSGRAFLVFLIGELGAGKTTFMQALARELGVNETVQSPTYVLMKNYPVASRGFSRLVHIDAYRLEGTEEFETLRPAQFLNDPHALVCIEWPERVGEALPAPDLVLKFGHRDEPHARDISIENSRS